MLAIGDQAEPLGFDGIWCAQNFGTPYGMTPNPLQVLTWFAARTERVSLGTMVIVAPWWQPVALAHQIAWLDIVSRGRLSVIGLGRGVAKREFDALEIDREQARQRLSETLEILKLALSQDRFCYRGEIFDIPDTSIRPQPVSTDLASRLYGSSASRESLEILSRQGLVPLFVGNKPIEKAGEDVRFANTVRASVGLPPCQPKNVPFMFCVADEADAAQADDWILRANMDVNIHYEFADASNFRGVKGYEAYADREAAATALLAPDGSKKPKMPGYHASNLMIGTPETVYTKIKAAQAACSFDEVAIVPHFGDMPHEHCMKSLALFAREVLPALGKMSTPLHDTNRPAQQVA